MGHRARGPHGSKSGGTLNLAHPPTRARWITAGSAGRAAGAWGWAIGHDAQGDRQGSDGVHHTDFLPRGAEVEPAFPVQPVRTGMGCRIDPSLPPVWANRDQLIQVILNLVKNAAEAVTQESVSRPEIILATGFQHGMRVAVPGSASRLDLPLFVSIRDNGPGIPDDIQPHLFEPFVTSKSTGSGLGLALVAKIIGDHGGLIEVDSRPGRTEFRLHLPVVTEKDGDQ